MYTKVSKPEKRIFDMTGPFPESLIDNRYWIGVVDDYRNYSWSFTKTNGQLPQKTEELFQKQRHMVLQLSI